MITWYDDFESSNIHRLGFDPERQEAHVEFQDKSGNLTSHWAYWSVSQADFAAVHAGMPDKNGNLSVGAAVQKHLVRSGLYSSRKIS